MRKLTITLSIVIVLGLLVVFGLPFGMGFMIKDQYQGVLKDLSQTNDIKAKLISFHRGWFDSTAKVRIHLGSQVEQDKTKGMSFVVTEHIQHGPFIIAKSKNGKTSLLFARALIQNKIDDNGIRFHSKTVWTMDNVLKNHFQSEDIHFKNGNMTFTLKGLSGNMSYGVDSHKVVFNVLLESASLQTPSFTVSLNQLKSDANYVQDDTVWFGQRTLTINNITAQLKNDTISINDVAINAKQNQQAQKTNLFFTYNTKTIKSDSMNIGPIVLDVSIKGLDTVALKQLTGDAAKTSADQSTNPQQIAKLYSPLLQLVSKVLRIDVNQFTIRTDDGRVVFDAFINIPNQNGKPSMSLLTKNTTAKANLTVPHQWLLQQLTDFYEKRKNNGHVPGTDNLTPEQMAELQIKFWLKNEKLVPDGDNLVMKMTFKNGQMLINDKPPSFEPYPKQTLLPNPTPETTPTAPNGQAPQQQTPAVTEPNAQDQATPPPPAPNTQDQAPTSPPASNAPDQAPASPPTSNAPDQAPTPPPAPNAPDQAPTPPPAPNAQDQAPTPPPAPNAPDQAPTPPPAPSAPDQTPPAPDTPDQAPAPDTHNQTPPPPPELNTQPAPAQPSPTSGQHQTPTQPQSDTHHKQSKHAPKTKTQHQTPPPKPKPQHQTPNQTKPDNPPMVIFP